MLRVSAPSPLVRHASPVLCDSAAPPSPPSSPDPHKAWAIIPPICEPFHAPAELQEPSAAEVLSGDSILEQNRGHLGCGLLDAEHPRNLSYHRETTEGWWSRCALSGGCGRGIRGKNCNTSPEGQNTQTVKARSQPTTPSRKTACHGR